MRKHSSNLVQAFRLLPEPQQSDLWLFYKYCHHLDEISDESAITLAQKKDALESWQSALQQGKFLESYAQHQELVELQDRLNIPFEWFGSIASGCQSDLNSTTFATWQDLQAYTWQVSGCVGLITLQISGVNASDCLNYARALGDALQLINILRDIEEDWRQHQRIYLPIQELQQFNYSQQELANKVYNSNFLALMEFQAQRVQSLLAQAKEIVASLQPPIRQHFQVAQALQTIYSKLFEKMRQDKFRVFNKRYRLNNLEKAYLWLQFKRKF